MVLSTLIFRRAEPKLAELLEGKRRPAGDVNLAQILGGNICGDLHVQ